MRSFFMKSSLSLLLLSGCGGGEAVEPQAWKCQRMSRTTASGGSSCQQTWECFDGHGALDFQCGSTGEPWPDPSGGNPGTVECTCKVDGKLTARLLKSNQDSNACWDIDHLARSANQICGWDVPGDF